MKQNPEVLILGGGVIGAACAYELSRRGAQVTILDKGEPGHGCSYGNAGWLTPCFAMPLPMPGMFFKALKWLADSTSPLYIKPEISWLLFNWLLRFLISMNERQMKTSVAALTEISTYSLEEYKRLDSITNGAFGFQQKGLLMVSQTPAIMKTIVNEMELVAEHGIPGELWNEERIKSFEPALTGRLSGGVYFPTEAHAEPLAVVRTLLQLAQQQGAKLLPRTEVYGFNVDNNRIAGVETTAGRLQADQYVLATGSWSEGIGRSLGLSIPVLGGKGYAIIVDPFEPHGISPKVPIMALDRKIAITPRSGSIRLAGTLELVNQDQGITRHRVDAILSGSRQFLTLPEKPKISEIWRGLRPCTPDGVPVIGRSSQIQNLVISTGHQMLGLQSAPGTARLVADIVGGDTLKFDPRPFRADRF